MVDRCRFLTESELKLKALKRKLSKNKGENIEDYPDIETAVLKIVELKEENIQLKKQLPKQKASLRQVLKNIFENHQYFKFGAKQKKLLIKLSDLKNHKKNTFATDIDTKNLKSLIKDTNRKLRRYSKQPIFLIKSYKGYCYLKISPQLKGQLY